MYIPVDEGVKGKDVTVTITPSTFLVKIGKNDPIINGEFYEKILNDTSVWTIETGGILDYDGKYIHVVFEKWKG